MIAELSFLSRVFDFMSQMPSAEDIVAIKATPDEEERFTYLSLRRNEGITTKEEEEELKEMLLAQHLMIIAKANALGVLKQAQN